MPELRYDPIRRTWVVIAEGRGRRPNDFPGPARTGDEDSVGCPFCPGHEGMTPPEVFAERGQDTSPDVPGWTIRIFANKFPAFAADRDSCLFEG